MKKRLKKIAQFSFYDLYARFRDRKRFLIREKKQKNTIDKYFVDFKIRKLQIGCGSNHLEGWLNTDLNDSSGSLFLDAAEKFPFSDDTLHYIYSEHLFEHLNPSQQKNMLEEGFRVLKKGGIMRIATPSIDFLHDLYSNPDSAKYQEYVDWAMGNIPQLDFVKDNIKDKNYHYCYVINNFFKAWGHQMIHNYSSLEALSLQVGFCEVKKEEIGHSNNLHLKNIEKHGSIIPEKFNSMETMILELVK